MPSSQRINYTDCQLHNGYFEGSCHRIMQYLIGGIFTVLGILAFIFNLLVIIAHFKAGNLSKNGKPIFVLAVTSLVYSVFIVFIIGFYCGPVIILQTYWPDNQGIMTNFLLDKEGVIPFANQIGQILFGLIFAESLMNMVIAFNRFLVMRNGVEGNILSRKFYLFIGIVVLVLGISLSYLPSFSFDCCKIVFLSRQYGFFYRDFYFTSRTDDTQTFESHANLSFIYIQRQIFIITAILPIICYTYVFGKSYLMRKQLSSLPDRNKLQKGDILRSIGFGLISFFFIFSWILQELFTITFTVDIDFSYVTALSTFSIILEAAMNGIIQFIMNESVNNKLHDMLRCAQGTQVEIITSTKFENGNNQVLSQAQIIGSNNS